MTSMDNILITKGFMILTIYVFLDTLLLVK